MMNRAYDRNGKEVKVGSKVRVVVIDPTFIESLPDDETANVALQDLPPTFPLNSHYLAFSTSSISADESAKLWLSD